MPDSSFFVIQYRTERKKHFLLDRLSRRRYILSIKDDGIRKEVVVEVTHAKHRGHLQAICRQFGCAFLGETVDPSTEVEEEAAPEFDGGGSFDPWNPPATKMPGVEIPENVLEKLADPDAPDPVDEEDDDL